MKLHNIFLFIIIGMIGILIIGCSADGKAEEAGSTQEQTVDDGAAADASLEAPSEENLAPLDITEPESSYIEEAEEEVIAEEPIDEEQIAEDNNMPEDEPASDAEEPLEEEPFIPESIASGENIEGE